MVTLPAPFIATEYPGYFFNSDDQKLYTMKITGVLRPLKFHKPNRWNHMYLWHRGAGTEGGFQVSFEGRKKWLLIEDLRKLTEHDAEIPVKETT